MILTVELTDDGVIYRVTQMNGQSLYGEEVRMTNKELRCLERPRTSVAIALMRARRRLRQRIQVDGAIERHKAVFDYDFLERSLNNPKALTATRG